MIFDTLELASFTTGVGLVKEASDTDRMFEIAALIFEKPVSVFSLNGACAQVEIMARALCPGWPTPDEAFACVDDPDLLEAFCADVVERIGATVEVPTWAAYRAGEF